MRPIVHKKIKEILMLGLIALALSVFLWSCRSQRIVREVDPCVVDADNLRITGTDINAPEINSGFRKINVIRAINTLLDRPNKFLYLDIDNRVSVLPHIEYNISGCQDVVWAKRKLVDILNDNYEYNEIDTLIKKRHYLITVIDNSKITPCIEDVPWEMTSNPIKINDVFLSRMRARCDGWDILRTVIRREFPHRYHKFSIDSIPISPISVDINVGYMRAFGYDSYKQYLNDSLGLDLVVLEEDSITMKAYKYLGLKEEENK